MHVAVPKFSHVCIGQGEDDGSQIAVVTMLEGEIALVGLTDEHDV